MRHINRKNCIFVAKLLIFTKLKTKDEKEKCFGLGYDDRHDGLWFDLMRIRHA